MVVFLGVNMRRKIVNKKNKLKKKARNSIFKKKKSNLLGEVTHYFDKINVAAIKLSAPLKVGDYIEFKTKEGNFFQIVESIQINHKNIPAARTGSEIGLKAAKKVKAGDPVYKSEHPTLIKAEKNEQFSVRTTFQPMFDPSILVKNANLKTDKSFLPEDTTTQKPLPKPQSIKSISKEQVKYSKIKFLEF